MCKSAMHDISVKCCKQFNRLTFYLVVAANHLNLVILDVKDGYGILGYFCKVFCILICSIVRVLPRFYVSVFVCSEPRLLVIIGLDQCWAIFKF
jgi:hypothetical protein